MHILHSTQIKFSCCIWQHQESMWQISEILTTSFAYLHHSSYTGKTESSHISKRSSFLTLLLLSVNLVIPSCAFLFRCILVPVHTVENIKQFIHLKSVCPTKLDKQSFKNVYLITVTRMKYEYKRVCCIIPTWCSSLIGCFFNLNKGYFHCLFILKTLFLN